MLLLFFIVKVKVVDFSVLKDQMVGMIFYTALIKNTFSRFACQGLSQATQLTMK
jgi:hypothetical protein